MGVFVQRPDSVSNGMEWRMETGEWFLSYRIIITVLTKCGQQYTCVGVYSYQPYTSILVQTYENT